MYAKTGIGALALAATAMTIGCERNERVNEEGEREVVVSPARPAAESEAAREAREKREAREGREMKETSEA
jgi:hypothetical protein